MVSVSFDKLQHKLVAEPDVFGNQKPLSAVPDIIVGNKHLHTQPVAGRKHLLQRVGCRHFCHSIMLRREGRKSVMLGNAVTHNDVFQPCSFQVGNERVPLLGGVTHAGGIPIIMTLVMPIYRKPCSGYWLDYGVFHNAPPKVLLLFSATCRKTYGNNGGNGSRTAAYTDDKSSAAC